MSVSTEEFFDTILPARVAAQWMAVQRFNAQYQFIIDGEGGGQWYVDATPGGYGVVPGMTDRAVCTLRMSTADLEQWYANPQIGKTLFFSGRMQVTGNRLQAFRALKLLEILELA